MPVVGRRPDMAQFAKSYENDPLHEFASTYLDSITGILQEHHVNMFSNPADAMMLEEVRDTVKNFFIENSCDRASMTESEYANHVEDMQQLFENDTQAVLEYAAGASFNPVLGLTYPIHKNIMMNCIFDNGVITKMVAGSPRFTISMETRSLVTPDGKEIDMWLNQNDMTAAIDATAPMKQVAIGLPELETTDILKDVFHATNRHDNLGIETYVSHVLVKSVLKAGETAVEYTPAVAGPDGAVTPAKFVETVKTEDGTQPEYTWKEVKATFAPYYGEYDRTIMQPLRVTVVTKLATDTTPEETALVEDCISGYMKNNKFMLQTRGNVVAIKLSTRLDTSTALLKTCEVKWSVKTDPVEIPNAIPINVPVSPEEVKDIGALYNVNQLTKIMAMIKLVLGNYKDDKIKQELDDSFIRMPEISKIARTFDFAPRQGFYNDHIDWRNKTFMDALDSYVTVLLQYLRDPNMVITVIGRSDIIRKLTPNEGYSYQTPSSIGPIELDYVKTVVTQEKRVYQFVSTDKMIGNNNLIILLNPRNTDRIIYRIYDYQTYVSNEIRNAELYTLPAVHAFERWKFVEYQPVQGRLQILNPTGLVDHKPNLDPIGKTARTDHAVTP